MAPRRNYSFVYEWIDCKTGKKYIGKHKGSTNDGYVCSSKYLLEEYNERPDDFKRRVLVIGDEEYCLEVETKLLESLDAAKNDMYYNRHNNTGFIITDEVAKAISVANTGRKHSPETIAKKRQIFSGEGNPMYGRKHSPETIEKMRQAKKGKSTGTRSEQAKARISKALTGRKLSEDHKMKISENAKKRTGSRNPFYGKTHSEKTKNMISKSNTGKQHSDEVKYKISESMKKVRQERFWSTRELHNV